MRRRRILALLLALAMVLSGCQGTQNEKQPPEDPVVEDPEVGDTPAPPVFTQEDLAEAEEIVADALKRGEAANLLHTGELDGWDWLDADGVYFITPFQTVVDPPELEASLHTEADIEAVYRRAFVPELAEQYIGALFSDSEAAYRFGEAGELLRNQLPAIPLSLIVWDRTVQEILEWTEEKLVVELEGRYMLTGHQAVLPLTLWQVDGAWLLDESFSPREYDPDEGCYTREEIQKILEAAVQRGYTANGVYGGVCFPVPGTGEGDFALVDLAEAREDNPERALYLQSMETVRQCFYDAFVPWVAEDYFQKVDGALYRDSSRGLMINAAVAAPNLCYSVWQTDEFAVYQNQEDLLLLLVRADLQASEPHIRPLWLRRTEGTWLLDKSFEADGLYFPSKKEN